MKQQDQNIGLQSDGTTTSEGNQNSSAYSVKELEGTPFEVVTREDGKSFITWGKFALTKPLENHEACEKYEKEKHWELTGAYCSALMIARDEAAHELMIQKKRTKETHVEQTERENAFTEEEWKVTNTK